MLAVVWPQRPVSAAIIHGLLVRSSGGCQFGEAFEVLSGCSEEELFGCSSPASEPEALQAEMSFQVGEQHLDLFSFPSCALETGGSG